MTNKKIFKIFLKKNIFLIFVGLLLGILFFSLFTEENDLSLAKYDAKIKKIELAFGALEKSIDKIKSTFVELKLKMSVVGTFHYKYSMENSVEGQTKNGLLKLVVLIDCQAIGIRHHQKFPGNI